MTSWKALGIAGSERLSSCGTARTGWEERVLDHHIRPLSGTLPHRDKAMGVDSLGHGQRPGITAWARRRGPHRRVPKPGLRGPVVEVCGLAGPCRPHGSSVLGRGKCRGTVASTEPRLGPDMRQVRFELGLSAAGCSAE